MNVIGIAAFALVAALAIWYAIAAFKREQARIASLAAFAASQRWQFSAADPFGLPQRWNGAPFDRGYARNATNVIVGELRGRPVIAFDYEFKEDSQDGNGRSSTSTYHYAICAVGMPCVLPELSVGREGVFTRLGHALGLSDIELESEDFNRRFKVRCPDRKLAIDVLTPRTMELLLRADDLDLRFAGTDVVSWRTGLLFPADVIQRTSVLAGVVDNVPSFVWKDYGSGERRAAPSPGSLT